jgi:hypothetical protein
MKYFYYLATEPSINSGFKILTNLILLFYASYNKVEGDGKIEDSVEKKIYTDLKCRIY